MRRKNTIMMLLPVILTASCTRSGEGSLSISVSTEETRAMSEDELLASSIVRIYKADFSGLVREYRYDAMPGSIYLPADSYRIDVTAGGWNTSPVTLASWDQKSYSGSEEVEIKPGINSGTTVTARISNAVTNVTFDAGIAEQFNEGYSCTMGLSTEDSGMMLSYTADKSGEDGYFLPTGFEPSLWWSFSGTLKNGTPVSKSGEIKNVETGKRYFMTLRYTEKNGIFSIDLMVDKTKDIHYDNILFVPVSTGVAATGRPDIWAGHFLAYADVDEEEYDADKVCFEYRKTGSGNWIRRSGVKESDGYFSCLIDGLESSTEYEYRLVLTSRESNAEEYFDAPSTIITDAAPQVPNSGFETFSNAESTNYSSFYDKNSPQPELQTKWWDSGNEGSTTVGSSAQICYPVTDCVEGERAAKLQSRYVVIKFAAGNLFSGHFGRTIGTSGGTVYFGRPFTARPTAMRLWAKYSSGKINRRESNAPSEIRTGDYDRASLRIALGTWDYKKYGGDADSPICVNTTDESTFVDYSTDESTIAFGEKVIMSDAANSTNEWRQITIPLTYRNTRTFPTHIVISFAASYYGDYFTGYDDSQLWVDKVELVYE